MDDRLTASRQTPPLAAGPAEVLPVATCLVCNGEMVNIAQCPTCKTPFCSERCVAEHWRFRHRDHYWAGAAVGLLLGGGVLVAAAAAFWSGVRL